jgi:hypothetical protein
MNQDSYPASIHHPSPTGSVNWCDFNDADAQQGGFDLIPKGTQALVRMTIKPGGYDDPSKGWTGGYATASEETGAVFLACEFVLLSGPYAKRKVWSNVGLHSNKGPTWGQMGRSFIKAVLNSSRGIHPDDHSLEALRARQIRGFAELDGLVFGARIGVEKDSKGEQRNLIRLVIEPDHPAYAELVELKMVRDGSPGAGGPGTGGPGGASGAPAMAAPMLAFPSAYAPQPPAVGHASRVPAPHTTQGPPAWAQ